jgi:hypothetical protein
VPLSRAQLSVKYIVERLSNNIEEARQQQYPVGSEGPPVWLDLLEGLRRTAESYLAASENTSLPDADRLQLIDDAAGIAVEAYSLLIEIGGADSSELPIPTIQPLQRWLTELGLNNTTVFRAALEANYELRRFQRKRFERYRNPTGELQDAISASSWPVLRITVPAKAFAIVPHLAVVAHEIGHAVFDRMTPDRSSLTTQLNAAEQRVAARLSAFDSETRAQFVRILSSWLEELTADAVMFYLTGPAGFFALGDVLQLIGGAYGFSKSHPASALRRRILFSRLSQPFEGARSYADVFAAYTGATLTEEFNSPLLVHPVNSNFIFSTVPQLPGHTDKHAAVIAELHEVMPQAEQVVYETVYRYLDARAKSLIYTPQQLDDDLRNHFGVMLEAIPPVETGADLNSREPAAFASILNVGWAVLLTKLVDLRVKTPDDVDPMVAKKERLHGLLLKAVELSEARRTWQAT